MVCMQIKYTDYGLQNSNALWHFCGICELLERDETEQAQIQIHIATIADSNSDSVWDTDTNASPTRVPIYAGRLRTPSDTRYKTH